MNKRSAAEASFGTKAKEAAVRGRSIQANVERLEAGKKRQKSEDAMQAGQRHIHGLDRHPRPGRSLSLTLRRGSSLY